MTDTIQKPLNVIAHELLTGNQCHLNRSWLMWLPLEPTQPHPDDPEYTNMAKHYPVPRYPVPRYDTDIAAAWRLVEAMRKSPFASIELYSDNDGYFCVVKVSDVDYAIAEGDRTLGIVKRSVSGTKTLRICPESAQSMPLAITTAFIEACKPESD